MSAKTLKNILLALLILLVGIVVTATLIKMKNKPERQTPPPAKPLVTAFTVSAEPDPVLITGFGTVKAKRSISVVPQVSGEILSKSASFEPGSFIKAGEVLLRIDDTDYVMAFETARSNVAQAEYNLALAKEEATVSQREWKRIGGTSSDGTNAQPTALVLHEPQLKLAAASLAAAEAAQAQAQINLDRCQIMAPFDGRVLAAEVDAGQYLRAGTAIGNIYATDIAEVTVSVSDDDIAWITVGTEKNAAPVDVSARFAGDTHHWSGQAVRLGGAVDSRSRLVPVVVEIPNPYQSKGSRPALIEGMFVEVTFSTKPQDGSVVVPRSALRPGNEVWVIGAQGKIDIRPVTVVRAGVEQAVISGGLRPGERICTSNLQYVTQKMIVRVEGDAKPEAPATGQKGGGK